MNEELQEVLEDCDQSMQKAIEAFRRELARIRTGRANLAILDGVRVDYYGSKTPLNQVASLTVADARLITIKPWDRSLLPEIEKAIQAADVGITPSNDGQIIRLPIPPLTGERRRELVRQVWRLAEDAKPPGGGEHAQEHGPRQTDEGREEEVAQAPAPHPDAPPVRS